MKNIQKNIFLSIYLCSISFLFLAKAELALAQQPSCQDTLNSVLRDIRNRGAVVRYNIDQISADSTLDTLGNTIRVSHISIALSSNRNSSRSSGVVSNILHSGVLMKSYANQIFSRCGGTGGVSFGEDHTDGGFSFVMRDDGVLGVEKCDGYRGSLGDRISEIYTIYGENCAYFTPDY